MAARLLRFSAPDSANVQVGMTVETQSVVVLFYRLDWLKTKFKILSLNGPWFHADPPLPLEGPAARPGDARDAAPRFRDVRSQRPAQLTAMITNTFFLM
jgi:hypothetical protein